jgi:hypothetical protein
METPKPPRNDAGAAGYVRSLRDAVKRRYAGDYLTWIRAGRIGAAPNRGALSLTDWKNLCTNLDALA